MAGMGLTSWRVTLEWSLEDFCWKLAGCWWEVDMSLVSLPAAFIAHLSMV